MAVAMGIAPIFLPAANGFGTEARAQSGAGPASVADIAEGLLDAVVNISTRQNVDSDDRVGPRMQAPDGSPFQDFFDDFFRERGEGPRSRQMSSLGSGFVIDPDGYIVTNNHVIEDADDIEINFADGSKLKAELVGADGKTDLALLKVDPPQPLTAVPFGDSESMRIGDWVMAIGNPFGLGGSVSVGIISARGRDIQAGPYDNFIQTDAAINRGNSGGPLFNMKGEVIGINTAIISPSGGSIGIGFAVPTEMAVSVIDQLREFGETRRGWLGVRIQPVTDEIAESLGMATARGALVAGVVRGGPVDDGSIEAGDVIVAFDGQPVRQMRDLPRIVAESPVGKAVDVQVVRKGEEVTVQVTLGRLEDGEQLAAAEEAEESAEAVPTRSALGLTFAPLDDAARQEYGIAEDVSGVLISEVAEQSAAADKRVVAGDVLVEIAQSAVETPQEVMERLAQLQEDGRRNALLMLANKDGELRFITLRMD
ncbi:DegQ family serine endoprotease [Pseudohoeflea sp. DP4N28-3]|uniref:DegQ family serine endoprotease n=2 Tax=Pseudohoeflea coraliihabitans TaxID=2860393 RepID=A0ABS6WIX2_9HYPH|nr:DegQ family serine endoprotease [Pseudohoeflea sp. DP4N28-3]